MKLVQPYIICHMASTINGKTLSRSWGNDAESYSKLYQQCHESFGSQAWMCGRVTMEEDFTGYHKPDLPVSDIVFDRTPFIADSLATSFAIAIDAKGQIGWQENEISGDHIIEVLTEAVSDAYLRFLRALSISYIFAGKNEIDFALAITQLGLHFPIQTIMLEGGGHINGTFLDAGLVDEISLLVLPLADTTPHNPSAFENPTIKAATATRLKLMTVEQMGDDILWLKYKRK